MPTKPTLTTEGEWERFLDYINGLSLWNLWFDFNNKQLGFKPHIVEKLDELLAKTSTVARAKAIGQVAILRQLVGETYGETINKDWIYKELDKIAPLDPKGLIPKMVKRLTQLKGGRG